MGVFEKIKNLFYDEEVIEVPRENVNSNNIKVKHNPENNVEEQKKDVIDDVISERDLVKKETNFKFPIIFEDEDLVEQKKEGLKKEKPVYSRVNEHQTKYKKPTLDREVIKEVIEKPKKFKPSPVISPVYGILDKNYKKEELSDKNNKDLEKTKELVINFDTIRQKAYGTLTDDIENQIDNGNKIDQIEKEIDDILVENNLLADLEEEPVEVKKVEIEEDTKDDEYSYSDFGVEYKISEDTPKEEDSTPIDEDSNNDDSVEENEESESDQTLQETDKNDDNTKKEHDNELTEDLFNLIDSMYDR